MTRAAVLVVCFVASLAAADWPIFRGNATQTGVIGQALPDPLVECWTFRVGADKSGIASVESTAAILGGVVYVGALDDYVHALDLQSGNERWKFKAGPIKAPLAAFAGVVYAGNMDGVLHGIEASSGKPRWKVELSGGITSGANVLGTNILVGCDDETLQCLSKTDGSVRWKFAINGGPVMGTPSLVDGKTFAAGCDSTLHILNAADGKELGTADLGGQVGASAGIRDGHFYVGTMSGQVLAVTLAKPEVQWTFESPKKAGFFASVAVTDRLVIAGSRDKRIYAIDRTSGKEAWSVPTDGKVDSSPVVAGNRVYCGSSDGRLYVLDLATGREVQRIQLDGPISASPAIGGDCLVVSTEKGTVYCFGKAK